MRMFTLEDTGCRCCLWNFVLKSTDGYTSDAGKMQVYIKIKD